MGDIIIIFGNLPDVKKTVWRMAGDFAGKIGLDKGGALCYNTQALKGAPKYRGVEQLEARRAHNPEVVGSSPASATIKSPEIVRFQDFFLRFSG